MELEVLAGGERAVEARLLKDDADLLADPSAITGDVPPEHADLAAARSDEGRRDLHGRALPRPIGSEKTEAASLGDLEIEAGQGRDRAEASPYPPKGDRRSRLRHGRTGEARREGSVIGIIQGRFGITSE